MVVARIIEEAESAVVEHQSRFFTCAAWTRSDVELGFRPRTFPLPLSPSEALLRIRRSLLSIRTSASRPRLHHVRIAYTLQNECKLLTFNETRSARRETTRELSETFALCCVFTTRSCTITYMRR